MNKATIIGALLTLGVVLLAVITFWPTVPTPTVQTIQNPPVIDEGPNPVATSSITIIGQSVAGRDIAAYTFGTGEVDILLVGGIHGGYEANTVRLAEAVIGEFGGSGYMTIPKNITVHIIPNLNPDGYALPDTATNFDRRMNTNGVDLNRNFDCRWEAESVWRNNAVSGGTGPFSEPEAIALRDYVASTSPQAAIFWHSQASAVYTSECGAGVVTLGDDLMNIYAAAADYRAAGLWTAYPVTGAAEDWLASIGIPALTVELETRDSIEWQRNWAAVQETMNLFNE